MKENKKDRKKKRSTPKVVKHRKSVELKTGKKVTNDKVNNKDSSKENIAHIKPEILDITLSVERYNPDTEEEKVSEFQLKVDSSKSILEVLEQIKNEVDPTLAFGSGCKSGNCGACGISVNGHPKLACETRIAEISKRQGTNNIYIAPMRNFDVLKDLIVDMTEFFEKIDKVTPYIQTDKSKDSSFKPDGDKLQELKSSIDCHMCGLCYSSCDVVRHDSNFLGPAALVKAYRFVADPRDTKQKERLKGLVKNGLWSCAHEYSCNYVCPKKIDPAHAIADLRSFALDHGIHGDKGVKTVKLYIDGIKQAGKPYGSRISVRGAALPNHRKALKFDDLRILFKEIERERDKFQPKNLAQKVVPGIYRNEESK